MSKATTVQARIELNLKKQGDRVLKKVGLTPSQAINAFYAQIVMQGGIPFEIKIPNATTLAAIEELELKQGKSQSFPNFQALLNEVEKRKNA